MKTLKNILEKSLMKGFFSNVGGSVDKVKTIMAPIVEFGNVYRKHTLEASVITRVLKEIPVGFGYKIESARKAGRRWIIVEKEDDDMFYVCRNDSSNASYCEHCDADFATIATHVWYFFRTPMKVTLTFKGEEI